MTDNTDVNDDSNVTKIYLAGSIQNASDDGRGWRNDLQNNEQYSAANIEFLNPLDEHDPRDRDHNPTDVVSDDLSLLDEADGVLLKYEHGRQCWGTPSEQGYCLAVNRHTDRHLPVAVWWDELGQTQNQLFTHGVNFEHSVEDVSPWLTDPQCSIGVYENRSVALTPLLSEVGHSPRPHSVRDSRQSDDGEDDEITTICENAPLEEVLELFCTVGIGTPVNRETFDDIEGYDITQIGNTVSFLETLGVVERRDGYAVMLKNTPQSQKVVERFVSDDHRRMMDDGVAWPSTFGDESAKTKVQVDD